MKPASISEYLQRLGQAAHEPPSPPRNISPFRPRSLRPAAASEAAGPQRNAGAELRRSADGAERSSPLEAVLLRRSAATQKSGEAERSRDLEARLAAARESGRR